MSTVNYLCGCSITRSMYGKRQVLDIGLCGKHLKQATGMSKNKLAKFIVEAHHESN
jgi:hypothetical protein